MLTHNDRSYLARLTQRPLLVAPESDQEFLQSINSLVAHEDFEKMVMGSPDDEKYEFWDTDSWESRYRPYNVQGGILIIPVSGVLLNRFSYQFGRYATGYQYIEKAYNRGMGDPEVKGIALVIDSPGGEVAGNFELVDKMFARRGEKPVRAYAADHAYSAAYSIASVADSVVVSRSGDVGSIGVLTAHVEYSDYMEQMGVKITFIFAGKHKVDGNPYEKLPAAVKARMQERIDRIYGEFVGLVARNRGMEEQAIRDTEALIFDAHNAVDAGLADTVGAMEEELVIFSQEAEPEDELMSDKSKTPAAEDEGGQITQAQLDTATGKARAEGHAEGVAAERERMNAILTSEEAKTHPSAAMAAVEEGLDADVAIRMMAKLPAEEVGSTSAEAPVIQESATTPFEDAMARSENPEVGAETTDTVTQSEEDDGEQMLNALAMASGKKRRPAA